MKIKHTVLRVFSKQYDTCKASCYRRARIPVKTKAIGSVIFPLHVILVTSCSLEMNIAEERKCVRNPHSMISFETLLQKGIIIEGD